MLFGLHCCVRAFSSCSEWGLLFVARASHCGGFFCCTAWALGAWASVVVAHGLSSCGSQALERRFSSCGARAYLLCGMWDLLGPGLEPAPPALAGGFLTTAPPGKSQACIFFKNYLFIFGCVGSPFLCEGFLQLRQAGATLHCGVRA